MKNWTSRRRQTKTTALFCLRGNYLKGVIASLISFIASFLALSFMPFNVPNVTEEVTDPKAILMAMLPEGDPSVTLKLAGVSLLLYLLLSAPLSIGIHRYYLGVANEKKQNILVIFSTFTSIGEVISACALTILSTLWKLLTAAVFFAIPVALIVFSPTLGPLAQIAGLVLYVVAAVMLFVFLTPCSIAPFILAQKPELGALRSIIIAYKKLHGRKMEFFVFDLSFILWRVFFGLNAPGMFFVDPYILASFARFYRDLSTENK